MLPIFKHLYMCIHTYIHTYTHTLPDHVGGGGLELHAKGQEAHGAHHVHKDCHGIPSEYHCPLFHVYVLYAFFYMARIVCVREREGESLHVYGCKCVCMYASVSLSGMT